MRGATFYLFCCTNGHQISIHAPHAGSDQVINGKTGRHNISIHAPHAGSDGSRTEKYTVVYRFQSTPPMRGATRGLFKLRADAPISIHAPHAGSDPKGVDFDDRTDISIHAPHAGSDLMLRIKIKIMPISIHAPHAGSDQAVQKAKISTMHFNPRPPCGERPFCAVLLTADNQISIHAPHAGSDPILCNWRYASCISIHAPHAGSDTYNGRRTQRFLYFNPRPPCGERLKLTVTPLTAWTFQSTPPMRGATQKG